jgi:hypothetical protein
MVRGPSEGFVMLWTQVALLALLGGVGVVGLETVENGLAARSSLPLSAGRKLYGCKVKYKVGQFLCT